MQSNKGSVSSTVKETSFLLVMECIISLVVIGIYLLIDKFSYKVISGAVLGTAVIVLNYAFLAISVNRAIDRYLRERGEREMDEEEAQQFAEKHTLSIQNAAKKSYFIRTLSMMLTLILAFVLEWFAVIPTLIPLLMFRPILYLGELIRRKPV